jgi:hypothetical protein
VTEGGTVVVDAPDGTAGDLTISDGGNATTPNGELPPA